VYAPLWNDVVFEFCALLRCHTKIWENRKNLRKSSI
jgi:hypothetical protein